MAGSDVASGSINIPYVPSGPFEMNATWNGVDMSTDYTHRYRLFQKHCTIGMTRGGDMIFSGVGR